MPYIQLFKIILLCQILTFRSPKRFFKGFLITSPIAQVSCQPAGTRQRSIADCLDLTPQTLRQQADPKGSLYIQIVTEAPCKIHPVNSRCPQCLPQALHACTYRSLGKLQIPDIFILYRKASLLSGYNNPRLEIWICQ